MKALGFDGIEEVQAWSGAAMKRYAFTAFPWEDQTEERASPLLCAHIETGDSTGAGPESCLVVVME